MELIFADEEASPSEHQKKPPKKPWCILLVDDDAEVHAVTRLALKGFEFQGSELELLSAQSAQAGREFFHSRDDIALTIVEPISNGLGSDNFAILWDGKDLHGLNSSGVAPAAWSPDYFRKRHAGAMPQRGWDSVTTPGAVAGWAALSSRFGKLPFADLMEPAIELAERGHGVGVIVADKWARQKVGSQ